MDFTDTFSRGATTADPLGVRPVLHDALDTCVYGLTETAAPSTEPLTRPFTENEEFWTTALNRQIYRGLRVRIQGHLTEWLPAAPGRYFTEFAREQRHLAAIVNKARHLPGQLYDPYGKIRMILGGIGSFRLADAPGAQLNYYLGLSTNGVTHQGIPVIVPAQEYDKVALPLDQHGGCVVDLRARVAILPTGDSAAPLQYGAEERRYCLVAEHIDYLRESRAGELRTTVYVVFARGQDEEHVYDKAWTYSTFSPCPEDGVGVTQAVEWLKRYADEYSRLHNPQILTDFDAYAPHFEHAIEFPLADICAGKIDTERLDKYERVYGARRRKMLTQKQRTMLAEALRSAFPEHNALQQMVTFGLEANLWVITPGRTLDQTIDGLILWADVRDRISDLCAAAQEANRENPQLHQVVAQLQTVH
jgi:hypothetical protein